MYRLKRLQNLKRIHSAILKTLAALVFCWVLIDPASAADPIKVGFSMSLTGAGGPAGKQVIVALEIWRDDVNAKGGLLGRPVELVYYDDQTSPANVPAIYTKLVDVDKVDLLLGPYATGNILSAMGVAQRYDKLLIRRTRSLSSARLMRQALLRA